MSIPALVVLALGGCQSDGAADHSGSPGDTTAPTSATDAPPSCHSDIAEGAGDWLFEVTDALPRFEIRVTEDAQARLVAAGEFRECDFANKQLADGAPTVDCGAEPGLVPGTVVIVRDGAAMAPLVDVGLELKGQPGSSYQPVTSKPYLELHFDAFVEGQTLDGLHGLRLYNQWEDPSQLGRYLGYKIWRGDKDASHPVRTGRYPAPRAGFASVDWKVGGAPAVPLGLYGTNEEIDADFLAQWEELRGATQLYEGEYGTDLTNARTAQNPKGEPLALKCADDLDPTLLDEVVTKLDRGDLGGLDQGRFLEYWALEVAVGAREGYASAVNNYYVAIFPQDDARQRKAVLLPTGFDQVLYDELPLGETDAILTHDPDLSAGFDAELREQLNAIAWEGARAEFERVRSLVVLPEGDKAIPNAYHATEADFARRNVDWYLQRTKAHLLLDLE